MRNQLFCAVLTAGVLLSATASAQTCQTATITASAPDSRYTDNGDGTVSDDTTGLMWKTCSEGQTWSSGACSGSAATYTWQQALQQAQTLDTGGGFAGYTDWRLPNLKELASLVEVQCQSPAINTTLFPSTPSSGAYWSSSANLAASAGGNAWYVSFLDGTSTYDYQSSAYDVRLVRGG